MKQADKRPCPWPYAQKQNDALGKKFPKIGFWLPQVSIKFN